MVFKPEAIIDIEADTSDRRSSNVIGLMNNENVYLSDNY